MESRPELEPVPTVLIVEPDSRYADALAEGFAAAGLVVRRVADGPTALRAAERECPDLLVVDGTVAVGPPPLLVEALRQRPATRGRPLVTLTPATASRRAAARAGRPEAATERRVPKATPPGEVVAAGLALLERATAWRAELEAVHPA